MGGEKTLQRMHGIGNAKKKENKKENKKKLVDKKKKKYYLKLNYISI